MDLMEKRKEVIAFLRNYNRDSSDYKSWIVLAAPAYGEPDKLRLYMNGGGVGEIALNEKEVTTGIESREYSNKYKGTVPDVACRLEKNSEYSESDRLDALMNLKYLKYVQEATATYSVKNNKSDKERTIESLIMDYRNQRFGNAAVDMEMQYSAKDHFGWTKDRQAGHEYPSNKRYNKQIWYNEYPFADLNATMRPRVDLMVLNDNGIGFVELKVDNKSCQNLSSHICHMNYILDHQDVFIKDADRRLSVLKAYNLLEPEMRPNIEKWERNHQVWCGILFVGEKGKLEGAKNKIRKELNDQNIKYCFAEKRVVMEGKINMAGKIFINKELFISPDYQGVEL